MRRVKGGGQTERWAQGRLRLDLVFGTLREGGVIGYSETWKKNKVQGVLRNRGVMEKVSIYGPFAHPYAGFAPRAAATTWRGALPRALGSPVLSHASFSL